MHLRVERKVRSQTLHTPTESRAEYKVVGTGVGGQEMKHQRGLGEQKTLEEEVGRPQEVFGLGTRAE